MSDLIRMTPEEVRASANQYRRQAEAVDGVIGDMDSMLTHLQSQWEGNSSRSFASRYAELNPGFIKAVELINEIASALDVAANTIEKADNRAAGQFGG